MSCRHAGNNIFPSVFFLERSDQVITSIYLFVIVVAPDDQYMTLSYWLFTNILILLPNYTNNPSKSSYESDASSTNCFGTTCRILKYKCYAILKCINLCNNFTLNTIHYIIVDKITDFLLSNWQQ